MDYIFNATHLTNVTSDITTDPDDDSINGNLVTMFFIGLVIMIVDPLILLMHHISIGKRCCTSSSLCSVVIVDMMLAVIFVGNLFGLYLIVKSYYEIE